MSQGKTPRVDRSGAIVLALVRAAAAHADADVDFANGTEHLRQGLVAAGR
jgi:hypothetical protein